MAYFKKITSVVIVLLLCMVLGTTMGSVTGHESRAEVDEAAPQAPQPPKFFSAIKHKSKKLVTLSWSRVSDESAKGYIIYKKKKGSKYTKLKTVNSIETTKWKDKKVKSKKTYSYFVCAYTYTGTGAGVEIIESEKSFVASVYINTSFQHKNVEKIKWEVKTFYVNKNSYAKVLNKVGYWPRKGIVSKGKKYVSANARRMAISSNGYVKSSEETGTTNVYVIMHNGFKRAVKIKVGDYSHPKKVNTKGRDAYTKKLFKNRKKAFGDVVDILLKRKSKDLIEYSGGNVKTKSSFTRDEMVKLKKLLKSNYIYYILHKNGTITFVLRNLKAIYFIPYNSKKKKTDGRTLYRVATCIYSSG